MIILNWNRKKLEIKTYVSMLFYTFHYIYTLAAHIKLLQHIIIKYLFAYFKLGFLWFMCKCVSVIDK